MPTQSTPELTAPPFATRCFFSFSSFWIFVLAVEARNVSVFLSGTLLACAVASFLHWNSFRYNSWLSLVDRFCASLVFVFVCVRGSGWTHYTCACLAVLAFICGNSALLAQQWDHHLSFHAMFRYFAYWMVLHYCRPVHFGEGVLCSCVYVGHFVCMCLWLIDEVNVMKTGGYPPPVNKKG